MYMLESNFRQLRKISVNDKSILIEQFIFQTGIKRNTEIPLQIISLTF